MFINEVVHVLNLFKMFAAVYYTSHVVYVQNIGLSIVHGVYISHLIRYSRACGFYQDFLDKGLLLTRKLLNQGFLLVKLKSPLLG
jgi:hypothetical protein